MGLHKRGSTKTITFKAWDAEEWTKDLECVRKVLFKKPGPYQTERMVWTFFFSNSKEHGEEEELSLW